MPSQMHEEATGRLPEEEEARRRALYHQGYNDKAIADEVGVTRAAIQAWRQQRGLDANDDSGLPEEEEQQRLDLYEEGYSDQDIAYEVGVSKRAIRDWRKRRGLPVKERNKPKNAAKVERQIERAERSVEGAFDDLYEEIGG